MAAEKREKEINGKMYSILIPSPKTAMGLCTESAVLFAPMMAGLGATAENGGFQVFGMLLRGLPPDKLNEILLRTVEVSKLTCNGQAICGLVEFEKHFDSNRSDLFPVCFWALWECVRDFLPDLGSFGQSLKTNLTKILVANQ